MSIGMAALITTQFVCFLIWFIGFCYNKARQYQARIDGLEGQIRVARKYRLGRSRESVDKELSKLKYL